MRKILVVGDSMRDISLNCEVSRISPEAPIVIYDLLSQRKNPGGAANVAANIQAMGGDVTLLTCLASGAHLPPGMIASVIPVSQTTIKTRVFVDGVMRARIDDDYILTETESDLVGERFLDMFNAFDVIVFSDYGKGALRNVKDMLAHAHNKITIVDPKGTNWERYAHAGVIKGNYSEVNAVTSNPRYLARQLNAEYIIQTEGAAGSTKFSGFGLEDEKIKPVPVQCVDPTGAGDSYLAAMAVALSEGKTFSTAAQWGSAAGALAVSKLGTAVVTRKELDQCLKAYSTVM
jgi:rfaE bifunctional protein kinase chain/domain